MHDDVAAPPKTSVPVWDSEPPPLPHATEYTVFSLASADDATVGQWSAQLRRSGVPHEVVRISRWPDDGFGYLEVLARDKHVGWRVAAAGDEAAVLGLLAAARRIGLIDAEVTLFAETCGRRLVFCAHCKGSTMSDERIGERIACRDCDRRLVVRPHVSRSTGTYLGVGEPIPT